MHELINKYLKQLKLGSIIDEWEKVKFKSKEEFLCKLLELEIKGRHSNRINRTIKTAGFKVIKTLDEFQWVSDIRLPNTLSVEYLENLSFIEKKENLIFLGAVGKGKTHLSIALALKACEKGKKAKFFTVTELGNILLEKNLKGNLNSFIKSLQTIDLLVIDEVGFVPLHKDAAELLFQVISDCYERRSLIITSNLEFSEWNKIFGDNRLTAALVDRLIHHSHIVIFTTDVDPSWRLKESINKH